jgi:hypothetical protein
MKLLIQRLKIALVSSGLMLSLGALLHLLAHYITYKANMFGIGIVLVSIVAELIIAGIWLHRLGRELVILKYKKRKKKDDRIRAEEDARIAGQE